VGKRDRAGMPRREMISCCGDRDEQKPLGERGRSIVAPRTRVCRDSRLRGPRTFQRPAIESLSVPDR